MREYRQNAHVRSLVAWALMCAAAAAVLFWHSGRIVDRALRIEEIAGAVLLLVVGPAVLAVYLIRAELVWVSIEPARGVLVRGKRLIPWESIVRIERRRPKLRRKAGPAEMPELPRRLKDWKPEGCADPGCLIAVGEGWLIGLAFVAVLLALFVAVWLVGFVLVPLIVVPVIEVLAPFGDRVRIVTLGRSLLLRDLREADEFVARAREHVEVVDR